MKEIVVVDAVRVWKRSAGSNRNVPDFMRSVRDALKKDAPQIIAQMSSPAFKPFEHCLFLK